MISRRCRSTGYDGVVIGELLAATCDDPSVLARIGGPIGEAARDAAAALGLAVRYFPVQTEGELDAALAEISKARIDAAMVIFDGFALERVARFTAKRREARTTSSVRERASKHTSSRRGSSDSDVTAFVVRPAGPSGPIVVTTVTPVANWPSSLCFERMSAVQ